MTRTRLLRFCLATVVASEVACAGLPGNRAGGGVLSIGTNPPGSVFYAVGAGIARVVTEWGGLRMTVQPFAGSSTFNPLLNEGEVDFGIINALDTALAYRGPSYTIGGRNPFIHTPDIRLAMRGAPLRVGLLVREDSSIRSVYDVKGRRMTGGYPAQLAVWYNMFGHLASAGLSWADVAVVPVPAINSGVDAVVQGRADVTEYALNGAKVREADAAVGVRHVSIDCSPAGRARLRQAVPGYYAQVVDAGSAPGIVEDTCVLAYDLYLVTSKHTPDAAVRATLSAIWNGVHDLPRFHPVLREWTPGRAVDPEVTIPYHSAAVRYFREQGVWPAEMDRVQERLLALHR